MTAGHPSPRHLTLAIIGLSAATVLVGLTLVGMTSSLPTIVASFGGTQADYATIITGSLLCSALGVPIWGNLADRFDRRMLLQAALTVLLIGSVAAATAPSIVVLIAARCAQGLAVGGIISLTSIIIGALVPLDRRSRYLGMLGAVTSTSIAVGPVICGLVTDRFGWRWSFGGIAVLALAIVIVLPFVLRVPRSLRVRGRFDAAGVALIAFGLGALLTAMAMFAGGGPLSIAVPLSVAGVLSLVIAVVVELRVAHPIVPLRMLAERTIGLSSLINLTVSIAIFGVAIFVVQYLQIALGMTVFQASLYLIPQVVGTVISSLGVAAIVQRQGAYKWWIVGGLSMALAALAGLSLVRFGIAAVVVSVTLFALGLGVGAVQQNLILGAQGAAGIERLGAATSIVGFFGSLGGLIGASSLAAVLQLRLVAIAGSYSSSELSDLVRRVPDLASLDAATRAAVSDIYARGLGDIFALTVPVLAIAVVCAVLLPNRKLSGSGR